VRVGLDSLYCRRVKSDLIMCYKVLHNMVNIDCNALFQRPQVSHTRGNSMKLSLSKHHVSSRRDGHFFGNRVINIWNSLLDHIVASPSVACFKSKLSKFHFNIVGSRPSDHYSRSVCWFVCLFVCAEFFSAVFDPISIKLGRNVICLGLVLSPRI